MSNPKHDFRGSTMVSCHSLNSTSYSYNCGCTGYARDSVSFIVFTASDPANPETLNNRKTSRQIFAYKPNNGVLLQSRMYTTKSGDSYGGVNGDTEDGRLYRDLIQREIASLEDAPNLWVTRNYWHNEFQINIHRGYGFGGYADWLEFTDCAKISVRQDHMHDCCSFDIGTYGLCVKCGEEIEEGLYCDDCNPEYEVCDRCGDHCRETTEVYNRHGELIHVCNTCLEDCYAQCDHCGEYHHVDDITFICESICVCQSCLEDHYTTCACCGNYDLIDEMRTAVNHYGHEIDICPACVDNYQICDECGRYVSPDDALEVHDRHGYPITICPDCRYNACYEKCSVCGELFHEDALTDGICDNCKNSKGGDSE